MIPPIVGSLNHGLCRHSSKFMGPDSKLLN